ncbi:Probable aquaporin SIP2-1 [Striga hermonthica]|uniref:Probable aquaporin SIP2-1 n=1 Tax=Striga hermonthica TaxID=68872 RepID=A0A9N7MPG1_STRHE|nr:Probable aquaporin SIP2-1 [Striga hermonthica]
MAADGRRRRLLAADFAMSFMWVWSSVIVKIFVHRILGYSAHDVKGEVVRYAVSLMNMFFFAFVGKATKGGAYNPLTVLSAAVSVPNLFPRRRRRPSQRTHCAMEPYHPEMKECMDTLYTFDVAEEVFAEVGLPEEVMAPFKNGELLMDKYLTYPTTGPVDQGHGRALAAYDPRDGKLIKDLEPLSLSQQRASRIVRSRNHQQSLVLLDRTLIGDPQTT